MTLKISESENLTLKYSFRSAIYFETISGHNLDLQNLSANDLITLFYCVFVASLQKEQKPIIDMISFLDIVDDNGGDKTLLEFSQWYVNQIKLQWDLEETPEEEKPSKEKNRTYASKKKLS